jgi:hypothetical protein
LQLTKDRRPVELRLEVSPGKHLLHFTCDRLAKPGTGNKPQLSFRVWNADLQIEE